MKTNLRLCCITKNRTNPAYEGARVGADRVARKLGCTVMNFAPETPDDPDEQEALLAEVLDSAPDAILIAPAHPSAMNATLQKVVDAGIPMIFFVTRADGIVAQSFVTSNNHALALSIADYLMHAIGGKGDLVIVEGSPTSPTSAPRTRGFMDAAAAHPGIKFVAQCCGHYQREDARRAMLDILESQPKFDGVLAANDFMAMGVIDAMAARNISAPIVGINATPDAIKAIKAGTMRATAAYDAMKMACVATEAAIRMLSGQPIPELIELPVDIVDAKNCDAWDRPYEERPLANWESAVAST